MFEFIGGLVCGASVGFMILALVVNQKYLKKCVIPKQEWCDDDCSNCAYTDNCVFYESGECK
jgi:hypothetical protein